MKSPMCQGLSGLLFAIHCHLCSLNWHRLTMYKLMIRLDCLVWWMSIDIKKQWQIYWLEFQSAQ